MRGWGKWVGGLLRVRGLAGCEADYGLDQHGQPVPAASLAQHWLVLNYWAQWCGPCRREIPQLNQLAREQPAKVRVLGVNFDHLQGFELQAASQAMGIGYQVLATDPMARFNLPAAEGLPITYLIDPQGKVRERLLGEQTAAGLRARLKTLGAL